MEVLVDLHKEKSKLAEDLSKIRMAESQDASLSNSKDEEITEQRKNCSVLLKSWSKRSLFHICIFLELTQGLYRLLDCAEEDGSGVMDVLQVVDIDSNVEDPQCCSFYVADIYDNIHVAEVYIFPHLTSCK